jgi:hypothetical protein
MGKRGNGEGSSYRRKNGTWAAQYTVWTAEGRKRRSVSGKTRAEVSRKLTEAMSSRDNGLVYDAGKLTVGEYLDMWLADSVTHEREVDPLFQAPIEVVFWDQDLQGEIVGEWLELALFDAHHVGNASWGEGIETQSTDPDIQRLTGTCFSRSWVVFETAVIGALSLL